MNGQNDNQASLSELTLPFDAFVRSVGVNKSAPHFFFLGAGASISSGVPPASTCVWQWKRNIFLTQNKGLENQFRDVSLSSVQQRIQQWLDAEGKYPPLWSPEEYSFFVERCYPIAEDRQQYFRGLANQASPYVGYQLLSLLAEAEIVRSVWTTNFDDMTPRAATSMGLTPIEIGLDTAFRAIRAPRRGELLHIALHGDYRYDALKNTNSELQSQDRQLRRSLIQELTDANLIVCGYSGRDESVMEALTRAYSQEGTGRLYWCKIEGLEPHERVKNLIQTARKHKRVAYYVPMQGFDDLLIGLALHCLEGDAHIRAQSLYATVSKDLAVASPPFTVDVTDFNSVIRSNAFAIECPSEVLQFSCQGLDSEGAWGRLRERTAGHDISAALLRGKVLALGTVDDIRDAFTDIITSEIELTPVSDKELSMSDGVVVRLLTEALVRSIAVCQGLETDGWHQFWMPAPKSTTQIYGTAYRVHDAALLFLRRYGGRQYLVVKPTVKGKTLTGDDLPIEAEQELRRELLTKQWNREFNTAVDWWKTKLFPNGSTTFEFPPNSGSRFRFNVKAVPALAKVSDPQVKATVKLSEGIERYSAFSGVQYREPQMLFSNRQGDGFVRDEHPIRGIVQNQPYDYALTRQGLGSQIRLGVVCPARDASAVARYLDGFHHTKRPDSKREYLLNFPGADQAFGVSFDIPHPHNNAWSVCPEPKASLNSKAGATALARQITAQITSLRASTAPDVIVIFIPERWANWREYDDEGERFDLHDYVKAYCVQRGIATQFLEESTFNKPFQCEVVWWLTLSLYVKAMRTPWVLESFDKDTAYVGLGFGIDTKMERGKHIILGCSHIYSSEGLGLRYQLRKIENPIIRQKNPFMSRDDARRTGDGIRQLFFDSFQRPPRRVVIHKRTPFMGEERDGLLDGLAGIECIDMLEVNIDPALRFVASSLMPDGKPRMDGFPIRRNTCLVLDKRRALLWVHGAVAAVQPGRNPYYLGKSRIPAPLLVTRHYGPSSLGLLAREILGLSKMNWNTFDMYTKLPATIQSSNEIAKIGALLERFGPLSYDYRLFI